MLQGYQLRHSIGFWKNIGETAVLRKNQNKKEPNEYSTK